MTVSRPIRILMVNENIGGHATVHHHLREIATRRDDIRIRIVDVPPPGFFRKAVAVAIPGLGRIDADLRPVRYQLAQSAWTMRQLPGWIAGGGEGRFDVVHFYTHNAALLSRRVVGTVPYVVTIDSTNTQSNLMHPTREPTRFSTMSTNAVRPFERSVYARARTVVANSAWSADSLRTDYGVPAERIRIVPMGIPVPPLATSTPSRQRLPTVIFIGRTMERKGGNDLLRVHQQWLADRCRLVLVTQDAVPPGRNLTVINDARPGDGRVNSLLASSDLMVLPSRLDQWPNAVMEAMSYGVPAVVSNVGGLPEMVQQGHAGVILPDGSQETLRDTINGLLDDPQRLDILGHNARRRVEQDLNVDMTANRLFDIIRAAAPNRPGPDAEVR